MVSLPASLARAFAQLGDPAILRVLGKSLLVTLALFGLLGVGLYFALVELFARTGVANAGLAGAATASVVAIVGGWLLFRIVALVVLQFFADEVVGAVEARFYPAHAANVRKVPLAEEAANAARGALRALIANLVALPFALALLVTGIGTALLFWAVNAWLLGRELQDMVWLRHRHIRGQRPPLTGLERFTMGGAIAGMMLVPFLNLIAPVIGAASATHMVHRQRSLQ